MRNFFTIPNKKIDVLVLDTASADLVSHCIPNGLSTFFIEMNNTIPVIFRVRFFLTLLKKILYFGLTSRALLSAIIDTINPKVIMTFIDNSPVIGELSLIYPNKLVIAIQNGIRMDNNDSLCLKNQSNAPVFFGFGAHQKNLMLKKQISIKKYVSVGSLRCSLFLSKNYNNTLKKKENNLCFISQYIKAWEGSEDPIYRDYNLILKSSFDNAVKWSKSKGFEVNVAMRRSGVNTKLYKDELHFFSYKNNYKFMSYYENKPNLFSSYRIAYDSSVIIAIESTLAFEMFGLGSKVLFCPATQDNRYTTKKGLSELFSHMPNFIVVEDLNRHLFFNKLDYLESMSENEYLLRTREAREYFMKYNESQPTHEIVSGYIEDFLTNKSTNV